jgi:DNA-binding XRE family transcriptional regulator
MILSGEKVKALRKKAGMSQWDLAVEIEMNRELISKIENNRRDGTNFETVYKLAQFFNVKIEELI